MASFTSSSPVKPRRPLAAAGAPGGGGGGSGAPTLGGGDGAPTIMAALDEGKEADQGEDNLHLLQPSVHWPCDHCAVICLVK